MEFLRTEIELKAFGKEFKLNPPTALKAASFKKELDAINKEDDLAMLQKSLDFVVSCGLDKETAEQLEIHHITKLIEALTVKKN